LKRKSSDDDLQQQQRCHFDKIEKFLHRPLIFINKKKESCATLFLLLLFSFTNSIQKVVHIFLAAEKREKKKH
jgi:hypothetical protein